MQGRTLTNDQIFTAVDCAIQNNLLPYATNAVYLLLGASNIKVNSGVAPPLKDHCQPHHLFHKTAERPLACPLQGFPGRWLYLCYFEKIMVEVEHGNVCSLCIFLCRPA